MRLLHGLLLAGLLMGGVSQAQIRGAGATFPSNVYQAWGKGYEAATGKNVVYSPTGSGDGHKKIIAREVDFGGSDVAMSEADLTKHRLLQLPTLIGGMVPVVNIKGVAPNALKLNGEVLADIFLGKVLHWNDKAITALNPGLTLPKTSIVRVVRSDKSGSSEGFSRYLSLRSASFNDAVGASSLPNWPAQGSALEKGDGNDGVVKLLKQTPGAISYVSFDRVVQQRLSSVSMRNGADTGYINASESSFRAAVLASGMYKTGNEATNLMNLPSADAWPVTMTTFVLVDAEPKTAASAQDVVQFLYWTQLSGDRLLKDSGFAPFPSAIQARFAARLSSIRPKDGGSVSLR
jgi:phosphate transport system substrate-binding protein